MIMAAPVKKMATDQAGSGVACGTIAEGSIRQKRVKWHIAEEVPVALTYNGVSTVVMMATPADLEDFAAGFSVSEGMVCDFSDIQHIDVQSHPVGFDIDIRVDPKRLARQALRKRAIEGRSGCGLCGVASLDEALRLRHQVAQRFPLDAAAIEKAFRDFAQHQPMNRLNHSVHGAAWCAPSGDILYAREDIGRHNALDKVIGALLRDGVDPAEGFLILSSRCSFELVQKAAIAGVAYLATISAPTSLALSMAAAAGMRLAALSPDGLVIMDGEGGAAHSLLPADPATAAKRQG